MYAMGHPGVVTNDAMRELLKEVRRPLPVLPDRDDQEFLIAGGWTRLGNGAILLTALAPRSRTKREIIPTDIQEWEYEVNDVAVWPRIDDSVAREARAVLRLETGLSFAQRLVQAGESLPEFTSMRVMVSVWVAFDDEDHEEQPATLRFFGESPGMAWLNDLERFEHEAVGIWSFPEFFAI